MSDEWYVQHAGQPFGPYTLAALARAIEAGQVDPYAYVSNPRLPWTRADQIEALRIARAEDARAEAVQAGWEFLSIPAPPAGEHWFHPIHPVYLLLLGLVSFGLYGFVWRYRQRQWALRRAGLPTKPIGLVFRGRFDLELDIALAADATRVRRTFFYGPDSDALTVVWGTLYICCWPGAAAISAVKGWDLYATAERVNRAVAPRARRPGLGFAELLVLLPGIAMWAVLILSVLDRIGI